MIRTKDYIKHWEGFRSKYYHCPSGRLTIGYGRNVQDNPLSPDEYRLLFPDLTLSEAMIEIVKTGITKVGADKLLDKYIIETSKYMLMNHIWFRKLSQPRKMVILDMIYNLGLSDFMKFKRMIKALKRRNYVEASKQIEDSRYYSQVGDRAKSNVYIMFSDSLPDYLELRGDAG